MTNGYTPELLATLRDELLQYTTDDAGADVVHHLDQIAAAADEADVNTAELAGIMVAVLYKQACLTVMKRGPSLIFANPELPMRMTVSIVMRYMNRLPQKENI